MKIIPRACAAFTLTGLLWMAGWAATPPSVLVIWDSTQTSGAQTFKSLVDRLKRQRAEGHFVGAQLDPNFRVYDLALAEHAKALKSLGLGRPSQPQLCLLEVDAAGLPLRVTWSTPVNSSDQALTALDDQLGLRAPVVVQTPTPSPTPPAADNFLKSGESLGSGKYLDSDNRLFRLMVQGDGNCVVYRTLSDRPEVNWETGAAQLGCSLKLRRTGLLEVVNGDDRSFWHSSYEGMVGAYRLRLQDDGDLVVELQRGSDWTFCWSSLRGSEGAWKATPGLKLDRGRGPR
ncbi:hypothetical protein ABS71_01825 [bacterium SCN 62-11]|nr:hypothetical protein [Candidatus Eremiobacteraeota bacterium]ODT78491.1 MAG: hypothetical protein ABS71_01825 [bacterium SCN 62-11]